jgi:hypothetical protein
MLIVTRWSIIYVFGGPPVGGGYHCKFENEFLAGTNFPVYISLANLAKITSTQMFVLLQYITSGLSLFYIPGSCLCSHNCNHELCWNSVHAYIITIVFRCWNKYFHITTVLCVIISPSFGMNTTECPCTRWFFNMNTTQCQYTQWFFNVVMKLVIITPFVSSF